MSYYMNIKYCRNYVTCHFGEFYLKQISENFSGLRTLGHQLQTGTTPSTLCTNENSLLVLVSNIFPFFLKFDTRATDLLWLALYDSSQFINVCYSYSWKLKRITSTTLLHNYQKYSNVKYTKKTNVKSVLLNENNSIRFQIQMGNAMPNTYLLNAEDYNK